ncbi:rhodanese-like domain-containing protein [Buchnera aphidicola (Pterocomma populeum)]
MSISSIIQNIFSKFILINNQKAEKLLSKEDAIIIDTRIIELFNKSHIIKSIHIPLENILSGKIEKLFLYKKKPLIFIFSDLNQIYQYTNKLNKYGFNRIYILEDSIEFWNLKDYPLISTEQLLIKK